MIFNTPPYRLSEFFNADPVGILRVFPLGYVSFKSEIESRMHMRRRQIGEPISETIDAYANLFVCGMHARGDCYGGGRIAAYR